MSTRVNGGTNGHSVFIAHTSVDTWIARQIAKEVRKAGARAQLDEEILRAGGSIKRTLMEAIRSCPEFIVLFTPWALGNQNVASEVGMAAVCKARIVPVSHRVEVEEIKRANYVLEDVNVIEINNLDDYFEDLKRRILEP